MRSFILVVVTAFVLSVGGLIYFWTQVTHKKARTNSQAQSTTLPPIRTIRSGMPVSDGDHVAVKKYDPRTGELASEFFSEQYTPRRGGFIDVKNAVARFYLTSSQQIIELRGETGTFRTDTPQEGKHKGMTETRAAAPNRGQMQKVTVTIIDTIGKEPHATTQPNMVISMPNAAFDSENATIVTEAYKDPVTGQMVAAEDVPVKVRSPATNPNGYDFDGRGMKMLWNERDHRLTSLDIIHGERLVIKNPRAVTQPKDNAAPQKMARTPVSLIRPIPGSALASADKNAVYLADDVQPAPRVRRRRARATTAPTAATEPTAATTEQPATQPTARRTRRRGTYVEPQITVPKLTTNMQKPIYRAEFHDHVRIVQNGEEMATADRMFVDFWMRSGDDDQYATGQPSSTQPGATTRPGVRRARATSKPSTRTASTQPTTKPTVAANGKPTTKPDEAPIYIYWTGPLHVAAHAEVALGPTDRIVTLEGNPVVAQQHSATDKANVSQILASRLIYKTEDGSVKATPLTDAPVTLTSSDSKGVSTIHTSDLEYFSYMDPPTAVLSGPSTAALPQADGVMLNTRWDRRCTLRFAQQEDGGTSIKEADITGNVHVDHPQMKLDSQRLELAFAQPPAAAVAKAKKSKAPAADGKDDSMSQSSLKQLVASDTVHCIMIDKEKKEQTIDTDRLTMLTDADPEGKLVPHTVNADGSVHAVDEQQDLRTDHLAIVLAPQPATQPAKKRAAAAAAATKPTASDDLAGGNVDLQSLIAQGNVKVIGKGDHTQAFADTMLVDKNGGKTTVKLVGGQPNGAKVIQKNNTVIGPIINIAKEDQTMAVEGAGEMIGTQNQREGEPAKPMDVTWTRNMRADGKANVVYVYGDVQAKTRESDGSIRTVGGQRAQLLLADAAPTTKPSKKTATTHPGEATVAVAKTGPTTRKSDDAMPDKEIRQAIFYDDARVKSELLDPQGLPVQRMNLWASELHYDVLPPDPKTAKPGDEPNKRITVPVPGTMLVEDYSAPSTQPAKAQETSSPMGGASNRGATAFKWQKRLVYDDATSKVNMDGSVIIDHKDLDVKKGALEEESMQITGERVIADIETPTEAAVRTAAALKAATQPTTRPVVPQRQMKNVEVHDHVHVTMKNGELFADWIDYNPMTRVLIAYGTPERDAVFLRAEQTIDPNSKKTQAGAQPIRAQQLQWDAGADLPKITQGVGTMRR